MLTSQHAETDAEPRGIEQQAEQPDPRSASIVFDARDRLDGTLDDTTVRQAVRISSYTTEPPVTAE